MEKKRQSDAVRTDPCVDSIGVKVILGSDVCPLTYNVGLSANLLIMLCGYYETLSPLWQKERQKGNLHTRVSINLLSLVINLLALMC